MPYNAMTGHDRPSYRHSAAGQSLMESMGNGISIGHCRRAVVLARREPGLELSYGVSHRPGFRAAGLVGRVSDLAVA